MIRLLEGSIERSAVLEDATDLDNIEPTEEIVKKDKDEIKNQEKP